MRGVLGFTVIASIGMCGCLSAVRVTRAPKTLAQKDVNATNVKGIPFYIKVAQCKQETSWLQPVYTLTLKETTTFQFVNEKAAKAQDPNAKPPEPIVSAATKSLSLSEFNSREVQSLRAMLSKPGPVAASQAVLIDGAWKKVAALPDYIAVAVNEDALVASHDVFEVSNTSAPEAIVDYSRPYYYNAPRPWIGSSQIDAKLASDGTLTESSSQIQSQTLSTILSSLPVSSLLTAVAGLAPPIKPFVKQPPEATQRTVQYDLSITESGYLHMHTRYVDFKVPCPNAEGGVKADYALTVQSSTQPASEKEGGSTVKVSGSIVLPPSSNTNK